MQFQRAMRILGQVLTSVSEESDGQKAHKRGRMDLAYVPIPPSAEELNGVLEHGKILPKCRSPEVSSGQEADGCIQRLLARMPVAVTQMGNVGQRTESTKRIAMLVELAM